MNFSGDMVVLLGVIVAAIALVVQLRALSRDQLKDQLHARDLAIATLQGEVDGIKEILESFARAFIDRRSN